MPSVLSDTTNDFGDLSTELANHFEHAGHHSLNCLFRCQSVRLKIAQEHCVDGGLVGEVETGRVANLSCANKLNALFQSVDRLFRHYVSYLHSWGRMLPAGGGGRVIKHAQLIIRSIGSRSAGFHGLLQCRGDSGSGVAVDALDE